jgi:hypothetical protein
VITHACASTLEQQHYTPISKELVSLLVNAYPTHTTSLINHGILRPKFASRIALLLLPLFVQVLARDNNSTNDCSKQTTHAGHIAEGVFGTSCVHVMHVLH